MSSVSCAPSTSRKTRRSLEPSPRSRAPQPIRLRAKFWIIGSEKRNSSSSIPPSAVSSQTVCPFRSIRIVRAELAALLNL
eukprot:2549725-Rhodomonas_salina.1